MGAPVIDQTYLLNAAKNLLAQGVVGSVDFKDEDLMLCLTQETLPTFSVYVPMYKDYVITPATDLVDTTRSGVYRILTPFQIIAVNRIRDWPGTSGQDWTPYEAFSGRTPEDLVDRQQIADISSATLLEPTFEFRAPNEIEIFPKGWDFETLTIELQVVHPEHLRTVPPGARERLRSLFLADIAQDVLGQRRFFESMQTQFGELRLNTEVLQAASDKREGLMEYMESKKGKTGSAQRLWIA